MTVNRLERATVLHTQTGFTTLRDLSDLDMAERLATWARPVSTAAKGALGSLDNMRIHWDRALWRLVAVDRLPADDARPGAHPVVLRIQTPARKRTRAADRPPPAALVSGIPIGPGVAFV